MFASFDPRPASFSIHDAAAVREGDPLVFHIIRAGNDGRAHLIQVGYSGGDLLVRSTVFIRFEPKDPADRELVLRTARGKPGDGDHTVRVELKLINDTASIDSPGFATGAILGAPPATATPVTDTTAFKIMADGAARRGGEVSFTVWRKGPLDFTRLPYGVQQEGQLAVTPAVPLQIDFGPGEDHVRLAIRAGQYAECGGPLTVTLEDRSNTAATAIFANAPDPRCGGGEPLPWWVQVLRWIGNHLLPVLGGVLLLGAASLNWYFRPFVRVRPSCEIAPGTPQFKAIDEPVCRWPQITAVAEMEPDDLRVTQPLPRSEQVNG
jgi:hypothetical protein